MLKRNLFILPAILLMIMFGTSHAKTPITSIKQLNDPQYIVGTDPQDEIMFDIAAAHLPNARTEYFSEKMGGYLALQNGKIDAYVANNLEAEVDIRNGLKGLMILPEPLGESVKIAAGLSKFSEISGLEEKFNRFIAQIKSDGTMNTMMKRWVHDGDYNIPDIDVPGKSNVHLTVGTTGTVMPFSFYEGNKLNGFDIELARRFAASLGAEMEMKVYDFGGMLMALAKGEIDIALSNLYYSPEHGESLKFSDVLYTVEPVVVVREEMYSPSGTAKNGKFSAFSGKRIGVFTGSVQYDMVREKIPGAEIAYFDVIANIMNELTSGKIDAAAVDETMAIDFERVDPGLAHIPESLGDTETAFLFPKSTRNNPLLDEMNEYLRRMKSDGTLNELRAIWSGADESKKIIPDYSSLPAEKGTIRIAVDNETPVFAYMKDRKLVGYDVDVIVRFCKERGYKPDFNIINFPGIIPAVNAGKCDVGAGGITITSERAENVIFSEPLYSLASYLVVKKPPMSQPASVNATPSRVPKYSHLSELDGKPIGMQPGFPDWEEWAAKNLPNSKVQYYSTYPDLASALKTHKIEGFLVDYPVIALMAAEDDKLTAIDERIGEIFGYSFAFAKTEAGKKLSDEMSSFIRKIKASGELDAIFSKWQGNDETVKIITDFKTLPATNGTLTFAIEGSYPPFNYYKGTNIAGIDVDLAVKFCEAYGYGLNVTTVAWDAMIPGLISGKINFVPNFTPSEEHEEAVYFSEPYCIAHSVMACLKADELPAKTSSQPRNLDSFAGKTIAIQTGTASETLVPEKIPSAKLAYYDSLTNQITALKSGKADALATSLPPAIIIVNEDPSLEIINPPLRETYFYQMFSNTEKGKKLCAEYSDFLKTLWDNGTIDALNDKWLGADEGKKTVDDFSGLPDTNGTVRMAVDAQFPPFVYVKDNRIVGHNVDLAAMFCKSKGYSLVIENMTLSGAIASIKTGKSDFSQSMNKTPEREENSIFTTTPTIKAGNVLVAMKEEKTASAVLHDISDLAGKKIGVMTNTINAEIAKAHVPSAELVNFDIMADTLIALKAGKVDAVCVPVPIARSAMLEDDNISYFGEQLTHVDVAPIFPKTDKGRKLCEQYSEFIKPLWNDGTLQQLDEKWFSKDESKLFVEDYSNLPNPNGTLKMAVDLSIVPFAFMKNGKIVGYDVDLAVKFCKAYGYGLEILPMSFGAVIPALQSGKCDFSASSIAYTEERAQSVLFSYPNAKTGNVFLVMKRETQEAPTLTEAHVSPSQPVNDEPSFWDDIASSFRKTFIREERWKLFAEGIMNTMIITVSAIFCGMLLGFTAFMSCRTGSKIANALTKFSVWLIKGTPIVVLLMLLYYVIFGHVNISGICVSIIAFTLTFGSSVYRMLTFGTGAVDRGQNEAAYALGFTDIQTFFTVILPQAALHFMPSFREEVTMLIKSTSVVGYIAVQDLTKMGDIVRSRTYEAFFPLIAVAVIYFVLAGLLNIIVTAIEIRITPSRRKPEDILRGIDTAGGSVNHD